MCVSVCAHMRMYGKPLQGVFMILSGKFVGCIDINKQTCYIRIAMSIAVYVCCRYSSDQGDPSDQRLKSFYIIHITIYSTSFTSQSNEKEKYNHLSSKQNNNKKVPYKQTNNNYRTKTAHRSS